MTYCALVVDDDPASRLMYHQILTGMGFNVLQAEDGAAGMHLLQNNPFHLVVLDMLLPKMSGTDLFLYARQAQHLRETTFIVISAHARFGERLPLTALDHFLVKPAQSQKIRELAQDVLTAVRKP